MTNPSARVRTAAELHTGPRATVPADPTPWLRGMFTRSLRTCPCPAREHRGLTLTLCCAPVAGQREHLECPCARCGTVAAAMDGPAWTAHYTAGRHHGLTVDLCPRCAAAEWPEVDA